MVLSSLIFGDISLVGFLIVSIIVQEVINFGCGGDMMSEYKSMVYYHEDNPKWFETFKVCYMSVDNLMLINFACDC